jgi:hypothetical protein
MKVASLSNLNTSSWVQNSGKARVATAGSLGRFPLFYDVVGEELDDEADSFELSLTPETAPADAKDLSKKDDVKAAKKDAAALHQDPIQRLFGLFRKGPAATKAAAL